MHFIHALATFITCAAALGRSCRSSASCILNNAHLRDVLAQIQHIQAQGKGSHHYGTGVQIACARGRFASMCAFYRNAASGTADQAAKLIQDLIQQGCIQCGTILTQSGSDIRKGALTIEIVNAPCYKGNCACPV